MNEYRQAYDLGKYFGSLDAMVQVMIRKVKNQKLLVTIGEINEMLDAMDVSVKNACDDNVVDRENELDQLHKEIENIDKMLSSVLHIIEETTTIQALFEK